MQAMCKLSVVGEMAGAFAPSNEVKSLLCTNNIYSVSPCALSGNGRQVCSDLICMSKVEFGFGFWVVFQKSKQKVGEALTPTA